MGSDYPPKRVTRSSAAAQLGDAADSERRLPLRPSGPQPDPNSRTQPSKLRSQDGGQAARASPRSQTKQRSNTTGRDAAIADLEAHRTRARNGARAARAGSRSATAADTNDRPKSTDDQPPSIDDDDDKLKVNADDDDTPATASVVVVDDDDDNRNTDDLADKAALSTSGDMNTGGQVMPTSSNASTPDVQCSSSVEFDYDEPDQNSPYVVSYAPMIGSYLHHAEDGYRPKILNYIDVVQHDINAAMREILIAWLVDVAEEFGLQQETLFLAKNYIDRYLSQVPVSRNNLQLVGITCMLIASKYEEMQAPNIGDFIHMTENSYTREDVIQCEIEILAVLQFRLGAPTEFFFFRKFFHPTINDLQKPRAYAVYLFSNFLLERSLQAAESLQFPPSILAAACLYLARYTLGSDGWNEEAVACTGFDESNALFRRAIVQIHQLHQLAYRRKGDQNLETVVDKYSQPRFNQIAALKPAPTLPAHFY